MTTLCYIEDKGKVLMLYRNSKSDDINEGKWIGIGGKFEKGESPEECLFREVYEETGLTLKSFEYRGIVTFLSGEDAEYMHLFTSSDFSGTLKKCDEGELLWIEKEKLYELPMWEGDKFFLDILMNKEYEKFFSLKLVYDGERLKTAVLDGKTIY